MRAWMMFLAIAGCGSGSSGTDVTPFIGSWTSNGTQVETCPAGSHHRAG